MQALCSFSPKRCITISPRHETEAWVLADPNAVIAALGYVGSPASIGLPSSASQAEQLKDPKETLAHAVKQVRGRRRPFTTNQIFSAVAQRQNMKFLRQSRSFASFESELTDALSDLGCI